MSGANTVLSIFITVAICGITVLFIQNGFISYIPIIYAITLILLVFLNILKSSWHPILIYIIGLICIYSTTLPGLGVNGIDMSRELIMSRLALENGWNLSLLDPSNTSFVVGFLVPSVSLAFGISIEWVYKAILPLVFAFTPVLLYLVFKKQIGKQKAFYASMFFIAMPVFSMEIATIGKSMVAETLMALCIWIMFADWKNWKKAIIITILTCLVLWAHYTIGFIWLAYLFIMQAGLLIRKLIKRLKIARDNLLPVWLPLTSVIVTVGLGYLYFANVSNGLIVRDIMNITHMYNRVIAVSMNVTDNEPPLIVKTMGTDPLIKAGIGTDFLSASMLGKVFRILQYITQLMIIIGCIWLFWHYKDYKFKTEFISCIYGSLILLLCCILIPSFAALVNMSRWYHMTLYFLAPMIIIGFDVFTWKKNEKLADS